MTILFFFNGAEMWSLPCKGMIAPVVCASNMRNISRWRTIDSTSCNWWWRDSRSFSSSLRASSSWLWSSEILKPTTAVFSNIHSEAYQDDTTLTFCHKSFSVHLLHLWTLSTTEIFEQTYTKTGLWACHFVDDKESRPLLWKTEWR